MKRLTGVLALLFCLTLLATAQQTFTGDALINLAELSAVAGNEEEVSEWIAGRLRAIKMSSGNLSVAVDNLGNVIARVGVGSPNRLLITPIDEPGYFVSGITEEGYLRLQSLPQRGLNPWFHLLHTNQPVTITGRRGNKIPGVYGGLSTHLQGGRRNFNELSPDHLDEVFVDVGARSASEARLAGVKILDPVTIEKHAYRLANGQVTAPFISARAGAAAVLNLLERMNPANMQGTLTVAFVTRSNMGNQGLSRVLNNYPSDEIVFVQPLRRSKAQPGSGALVASFGDNAELRDELLAKGANTQSGPDQRAPAMRYFGAAQLPARSAVIGFPVMFPQTPAEIVSRKDIEAAKKTLSAWLGTDETRPTGFGGGLGPGSGGSFHGDIRIILKRLIETYGVSGYEEQVAKKIIELMPEWAKRWATIDSKGNVIVSFGQQSNKPKLLFVAHSDEIGWEVQEILADGRLKLRSRGGMREEYFLGHAVLIHTKERQVPTVLELPDEYRSKRFEPVRRGRGYIAYTGARTAEEAAKLGIKVGDSVTVPKKFRKLAGRRASGRSCDNRCGSAALLAALWQIKPEELGREVDFVWAVEEELGLNGAKHVAQRLHERDAVPEFVFAVDTFVSSDAPLESKRYAFGKLGKGFVVRAIDLSNIVPRKYVDQVTRLARLHRIPVQTGTMNGGNDGAAFVPYGSVDIPIAWPLRYSHSAGEVFDMGDLEALSKIIVVLVKDF